MELKLEGQNAYILDIEANNLYPFQTKVWTLRIKRLGADDWLKLNPFNMSKEEVKKIVLDYLFREEKPFIVGHNYLGYDGWVMWKEFGLEMSVGADKICGRDVRYFDTLYASQYLLPDRENGHSLKSWGIRYGDFKIDYRNIAIELGLIEKSAPKGAEFSIWHPEMDIYCEKDCLITERLFTECFNQITEEDTWNAFKLGQKSFYLMSAQAFTGFKFDKPAGEKLKIQIEQMIQELKLEVEPDLPQRKLKKSEEAFYTMPAKPYTQDGQFSSHMRNFIKNHEAEVIDEETIRIKGEIYYISPKKIISATLPMNLEDQNALKDYFLESGWKPSLWNVKKDAKGKAMRDEKKQLIKTSPKIQEAGKICPNLLELDGELPKKVVRFLSLRNRLGVLNGWLTNERLQWDGRLSAGASGIASTHRQKHVIVVNVPKAQDDVLLGKEYRSLFTVEEGNDLIGVDQAALEARCQGNWTYKYDNGESARELIDGDIHSKNAKAFYEEETVDIDILNPDFDKDSKEFKPFRSKSKNGYYGIIYGCSGDKLASTLGKPSKLGNTLLEKFWDANPALKKLKDRVEEFWKSKGNKKWIPGLDGRRLYSRSQHSLINLLMQSTASIIVDYSLCLFDQKMGGLKLDELGRPYYEFRNKIVKRVQYTHDEYGVEAESSISKEISEIMEWTMSEAGIRLNLSVPLVGEAKIGKNWKETH